MTASASKTHSSIVFSATSVILSSQSKVRTILQFQASLKVRAQQREVSSQPPFWRYDLKHTEQLMAADTLILSGCSCEVRDYNWPSLSVKLLCDITAEQNTLVKEHSSFIRLESYVCETAVKNLSVNKQSKEVRVWILIRL